MSDKFERFAQRYHLNARGRKALGWVAALWDVALAFLFIYALWVWIWVMWAAFGV